MEGDVHESVWGARMGGRVQLGQLLSQWDLLSPLELLSLACAIPFRSESVESPDTAPAGGPGPDQPSVIPTQGDLLGDLLNLDLGPPVSGPPMAAPSVQMGAVDLLGGGLDTLVRPNILCCFPASRLSHWPWAGLDAGSALGSPGMGQSRQPGDIWAGPFLQWVRAEGHHTLI